MTARGSCWVSVFVLLLGMAVSPLALGDEKDLSPSLYPPPKQLQMTGGSLEVTGKAIVIPEEPGPKLTAIAKLLQRRLKLRLDVELPINQVGTAPDGLAVLAIVNGAPDWQKLVEKASLQEAPDPPPGYPLVELDQRYALTIDEESVVIVAYNPRGLSFGAITLMQLARGAGVGTKLPTLSIVDWPDMVLRSAHGRHDHGLWESVHTCKRVAVSAMDMKYGMIIWETDADTFRYETHPELLRGRFLEKDQYVKLVDLLRSGGVEPVPLHNMSDGHNTKGGHPYPFLGDGETYFWAMTELIDERLEVFRPKYFHLGMDEEQFTQRIKYPKRTLKQWRDVATRFTEHCRRRGVATMMWSDQIWNVAPDYKWWPSGRRGTKGYYAYLATFPSDLFLVNWLYYEHRFPMMEQQAKSRLCTILASYWGGGEPHVRLVKQLRPKYSNIPGMMGTMWRGNNEHRKKLIRNAGVYWNVDAVPEVKVYEQIKAKFKFQEEDFQPMGWEVLLEHTPAKAVPEALGRLADEDWQVWLPAREELVSSGLPIVAELLQAMADTEGELRQRIEGCISRNARDARQGWRRGELDTHKVIPYLKSPAADLRAIAAEVIASCNPPEGCSSLYAGLKDVKQFAACARALGIVKDTSAAKELVRALGDANMPADARAEAAHVLGVLRAKEAVPALLAVLKESKEDLLTREALWSLALLGETKAGEEIAKLLESSDQDTRWRAGIALALLKSRKVSMMAPWLAGDDRHSLELAAWAIERTLPKEEWQPIFEDAKEKQQDENSTWRLNQILEGKHRR